MSLSLDAEELNACVACGLCLPHCPTYRVTGDELLSPRGRIEAMRGVELRGAPVDDEFVEAMSTCVQCRGCEPACPSGVPFGHLIEATRTALADDGHITPRWQRIGLGALSKHRLVVAGSAALGVAQRLKVVPRRLNPGSVPVRSSSPVIATGDDVWLFTGCVMDAWFRDTHHATLRVLTALGVGAAVPGSGGACCGALHTHAGLHDDSVALAHKVMASMPGDEPIVVNSAGCGAALKEYGHLVGTDEALRFANRVVDVNEYVAQRVDDLAVERSEQAVIVQDPCHLRHVQRAHLPVRSLIERVADVVELDDEGLCCGAGGAYSMLQPGLADDIRQRKVAAIRRAAERTGATLIVSANPGCISHLRDDIERVGLSIRHPIDVVADALA